MARYPNILCRVNAIKPEFVVRYINNFPKEPLPSAQFYEYVERRMSGFHSRNYKQAPLQWGLYYEENGYCYPRFNADITEEEAKKYIDVWLHNLVVPNPYCNLSQIKEPVNLIVLLCEYMKANPKVKYLHDIAYGACKERVKAIDILKNTIVQSNLFSIRKGKVRFYKVKVKNNYENIIGDCSNRDSLLKLASYFKNVYDPEEELTFLPKNILGKSISFEDLKVLPNIEKVLEFKPEYNIIVDFAPNFKNNYKSYKNMNSSEYFHLFDGVKTNIDQNAPLQQIFYGAPGTGKSHEIKKQTKGKSVIRTTFHPDSDYSTFVGCYKPSIGAGRVYGAQGPLTENGKPIEEPKITYKYVIQAFLKAYLGAWKKYVDRVGDEVAPQFLIIEEINRGNCAQIFGDLFQLLDRGGNGFSEYPIEADNDIQKEIERAFKEEKDGNTKNPYKLAKDIEIEGIVEGYTSNYGATLSEDVQHGRVLLLPKNLYIWATMNTSDQSLFPIDSAFKRRWEWKYVPISDAGKKWKISVNGMEYDWWSFIEQINNKIWDATHSEDKKLGYFFCKADRKVNENDEENMIISADKFVGKVLFYIYNDVFKDYGFDDAIFKDKEDDNSELTFQSYFMPNGKPQEKKIEVFLNNLQVKMAAEVESITGENNSDESEIQESSDEEPSSINTLSNDIDTEGSDYTKYNFDSKKRLGKGQLAVAVIEKYMKEHPNLTFDDLRTIFPDSMMGDTLKLIGLIVKAEDVKNAPYTYQKKAYGFFKAERRYKDVNGTEFFVSNYWNITNIQSIIDFAKQQGWSVEPQE